MEEEHKTENKSTESFIEESIRTDNPVKRHWRGGSRPGAGRPLGSKDRKTKERKEIEKEYINRILRNAHRLFNAQMLLAQGQSMLFKKVTEKDEKGKTINSY